MRTELPYLMRDQDRHGNERVFVRRNGKKIRIRAAEGTAEFAAAYTAAIEALDNKPVLPVERIAAPAGSFAWLAASYFASAEFKALDTRSQATRRAIIESCLHEPLKPGTAERMANVPAVLLSAAHVRVLRDRKADKPGAANNRVKYIGAMLGWAVERGHLRANPARDVRRLRYATDGFHAWTVDEVRQFLSAHPVGTKAALALALLLYLGVRRGDVVTLGRQHVKDGLISFVPRKTRYKRKTLSHKPVLPVLVEIIAVSPCGDLTFLVNDYGRPFTAAGFGNKMRQWCNAAGLRHCSAHGLRKAGAIIAAENGATVHQLMAIYDWTTPGQAEVYTRAADRKRLAGQAMGLLARGGT